MNNFNRISDALRYIDAHLDESLNREVLSEKYCFSPFYFHRLFSVIVGKSLAAYIRDRRILFASKLLCSTEQNILEIAFDCGYPSAQSFSRAFKEVQGISPREYRKQGCQPVIETPDVLVKKFTNRLKGGVYLQPRIIKRDSLMIAGVHGDGSKTGEIWEAFEKLRNERALSNALSNDGYEVRVYKDQCIVYVGHSVSSDDVDEAYSLIKLPASKYASFDVYVADGYDSENNAMQEWMDTNSEGYSEKLMKDGSHYCIEYYDERFNGNEADSIVEIWIPIER